MIRAKQKQQQRFGFSLVEVLLAIFILGIGVISIVSLFPAGIAMQRQSVDDIIGPTVAQNAIATIRNRVRPEDFGTPEEFGNPSNTIHGDFGWSRPAFYTSDLGTTTWDDRGTTNLFIDLTGGGRHNFRTAVEYFYLREYTSGYSNPTDRALLPDAFHNISGYQTSSPGIRLGLHVQTISRQDHGGNLCI